MRTLGGEPKSVDANDSMSPFSLVGSLLEHSTPLSSPELVKRFFPCPHFPIAEEEKAPGKQVADEVSADKVSN